MDPQTQELLAFADTLADAGRAILLDAMARDRDVRIKADASMVTATDLAIETRLREMIEFRYPEHGILGEEHGSVNLEASFVWVLDPIDGTAPFVAGIPVYGTLIGLARDGAPHVGVIDHPATDERWSGVSGVLARKNGAPVAVRSCDALASAYLTNSNPDFFNAGELQRFHALRRRVRYAQYGGSCYAYACLASGRTDLAVDTALETFDIYACAAVIEGAGGVVTDWTGAPITLDWKGQVIAAGDRARHDEACQILGADR